MSKITNELIQEMQKWLGDKGVKFFRDLKEEHGRVDPCLSIDCSPHPPLPHPVHFREGIAVRNKMRELTAYSWTDHEYDDNWVEVIERAIQ